MSVLLNPPIRQAANFYVSYRYRNPMKKKKAPLHGIKLFTGIALCFFLTSCTGQTNKGGNQLIIKETIQSPDSKKQISPVVRMMYQDSKGNLWFGAEGGAFRYDGYSLIHIDSIRSESGGGVTIKDIAEDKDGKIWFGHTDGISSINGTSVTNYYESDGLISNDVWCIETDVNGNVWIGTIEGTCIFDGQKFTKFNIPEGKIDTTVGVSSTKMIHSILEADNGTIWLSTNAGLFSYTNKKLKNISAEVGVPTNFISKIVEDKKGGYWVSTSKGLFYL
jgi:ligand-binding sensor domain-containing protein